MPYSTLALVNVLQFINTVPANTLQHISTAPGDTLQGIHKKLCCYGARHSQVLCYYIQECCATVDISTALVYALQHTSKVLAEALQYINTVPVNAVQCISSHQGKDGSRLIT
jgi:hypothetical protein